MDARIGQGLFLLGLVVFIAIRAPHDRRRADAGFGPLRIGLVERLILPLLMLGMVVLPLLAIFTPWLGAADLPFTGWQATGGSALLAAGLWLFHRSHADLGRNWSPMVQIREGHQLVVEGVYRWIRHPMYSSFLLYGAAQALLLANWIAGPSFLIAAMLLTAARLGTEERTMAAEFGEAYREYARRTKRMIPGVW